MLAPGLVAGASLAGRRFGARVSGWLVGFPIVAGPILYFYDVEQGHAFAAAAAQSTLVGLVSLCVFLTVYLRAACFFSWPVALLAGWAGFALPTVLMQAALIPWTVGLPAALSAIAIAYLGLPALPAPAPLRPPPWDLRLRMAATAALVLALTGAASLLGPRLSGLLTPFPVASTVLAVFAHRQSGPAGVAAVYRGFLPGLAGFSVFCAILAKALPALGTAPAFALAMACVGLVQFVALAFVRR